MTQWVRIRTVVQCHYSVCPHSTTEIILHSKTSKQMKKCVSDFWVAQHDLEKKKITKQDTNVQYCDRQYCHISHSSNEIPNKYVPEDKSVQNSDSNLKSSIF